MKPPICNVIFMRMVSLFVKITTLGLIVFTSRESPFAWRWVRGHCSASRPDRTLLAYTPDPTRGRQTWPRRRSDTKDLESTWRYRCRAPRRTLLTHTSDRPRGVTLGHAVDGIRQTCKTRRDTAAEHHVELLAYTPDPPRRLETWSCRRSDSKDVESTLRHRCRAHRPTILAVFGVGSAGWPDGPHQSGVAHGIV